MNPKVFLDITVDGDSFGRIVIELFKEKVPLAAENFRCLCTGEKGLGKLSGLPLHYEGSIFHQIIPYQSLMGGHISGDDLCLIDSIYGGMFIDENLSRCFAGRGLVSMANCGPNTNGSVFVIWLEDEGRWTNDESDMTYVVVGQVVEGMQWAMGLGAFGSWDGPPTKPVVIAKCGEILP